MNKTTPAIQDLARRLVALEVPSAEPSDGLVGGAVRACEKLRAPIAKLAGTAGFRSLLSRALAMAKAEDPSLEAVQVRPDGSLDGLDGVGRTRDAEAEAVVVAQLLGLLMTFIGGSLTLRLVREAWPDEPVTGIDAGSGGGS